MDFLAAFLKRCPHCMTLIHKEATVCPYCRRATEDKTSTSKGQVSSSEKAGLLFACCLGAIVFMTLAEEGYTTAYLGMAVVCGIAACIVAAPIGQALPALILGLITGPAALILVIWMRMHSKCTKCGAQTKETDKVCPGCGASLFGEDEGSVNKVVKKHDTPTSFKPCPFCEKPIPSHKTFCPHCFNEWVEESS